jgi:hypothetical protein
MKSIKTKKLVLTALIAAVIVLAGCASKPKAPEKPKQLTEALDWKGAALGTQIPEWVIQAQNNVFVIESLSEFKDSYCFVVDAPNESSLDYAVAWVSNTANGAARVGTAISTSVNGGAEAAFGAERTEGVNSMLDDFNHSMIDASFAGLRKAGDFWMLNRNTATKREYYTGYGLWVIDKKRLDDQIVLNMQNLAENNKALSAAERTTYADIINDIRSRGFLGTR